MKEKRRILSLILAIALMISTWSVPVFAEEMTADREIKAGETITVTKETVVKFVPKVDYTYYFKSERKNGDPKCWLYKDGKLIESFDDDGLSELGDKQNRDFQGKYDFTAGETYYFKLGFYRDDGEYEYEFSISSNFINHQPDSQEPYVKMLPEDGVTYQWCEVTSAGDVTPGSVDFSYRILGEEKESTLKNPEIGKRYFCRMKVADGSYMDTDIFTYEYAITHSPKFNEPYVTLNETEGVTYQWYKVTNMEEVTPGSVTSIGESADWSEEKGWSGADGIYYEYSYYEPFSIELKKGDILQVDTDGMIYDKILLYDYDSGREYVLKASGIEDDTYVFNITENGEYELEFEGKTSDMSVKVYRIFPEAGAEAVQGETGSRLVNAVPGESYFCRVRTATGVLESEVCRYKYMITHQPEILEPWVEDNYANPKTVTWQWYSYDEITDVSADSVLYEGNEESFYDTSAGWNGSWDMYDDYDYLGEFLEKEFVTGESVTVEVSGEIYGTIGLYDNETHNDYYQRLSENGEIDGTYTLTAETKGKYEIYVRAYNEDVTLRVYTTDGQKLTGETESRLKNPEIGKLYICKIESDAGSLSSELFTYGYAFKHNPTPEEPYVTLNETENVTYQWYRLDFSGAEKVMPKTENVDGYGSYEEGSGWMGYREEANYNPDYTYYCLFEIYLCEGEVLTVQPKGTADRIFLTGPYDYYRRGKGENAIYSFTVDSDGWYDVYFYGITDDMWAEAWLGDITSKTVSGEVCSTLEAEHGEYYYCVAKGENGRSLTSQIIDTTYKFTHRPVNGEAYSEVNYPEEVASVRWYQGTFSEEITTSAVTASAVTSSAVTSSAVTGSSVGTYDSECGWTAAWEKDSDGDLYGEFFYVDLTTGESITVEVDGTIMGCIGIYDNDMDYDYYYYIGWDTDDYVTDGIYTLTAEKSGRYVLYLYAPDTNVTVRACHGELTGNLLENQDRFTLYNVEDGLYCCEVEYNNGKILRSSFTRLENIETLSGAGNPVISQKEPGYLTASWDAAENASGYAVNLYRDGEKVKAVTTDALEYKFDIAEKGSYSFTVSAEKRKGADVNTAVVTSEAIDVYAVSFNANGASTPPAVQFVAGNAKAVEPETPVRKGYSFDGWYNGETEWNFATEITGDVVLEAKWTRDGILGDVDDNGKISAEDALMVLKAVAHMITLDEAEEMLADVNGDGNVSAEDALQILKYVAHMITGFENVM